MKTAKITASQKKALNNLHENGRMLTNINGRPGCHSKSCKALVKKNLVDIVDWETYTIEHDHGTTETCTFRYFQINDAGRACICTDYPSDELFVFIKSTDWGVEDDSYVLDSNPDITIQVALYAGGFFVNRWDEEEKTQYHLGSFRDLDDAKVSAINANRQLKK